MHDGNAMQGGEAAASRRFSMPGLRLRRSSPRVLLLLHSWPLASTPAPSDRPQGRQGLCTALGSARRRLKARSGGAGHHVHPAR